MESEKINNYTLFYHYGDTGREEPMHDFFAESFDQANAYVEHAGKHMSAESYDAGDYYFAKPIAANDEPADPDHYNDDMIDVRHIPEFCMMVLTNCDGDTKAVGYDGNFFAPIDIVEAYKSLWRSDWNMGEEKPLYVQKLKEWMIATGCQADELEEE